MQELPDQLPDEVITGLDALWNEDFYSAHEYFEDAWRETPDSSREFFRALLHISGGFFRLTQARPVAAKKFFTHAIKWLSLFPSSYAGVNIDALISSIKKLIISINLTNPSDEILKQHFEPIRILLDMRFS